MNKSEAQESIKKITSESHKLDPSCKVIFYEIDITDLALDLSIVTDGEVSSNPNSNIIRLHNNYKLFSKNITWQGNTYIVAPIQEEGFEVSSTGTLPSPKISISIEENSGAEPILGKLRNKIDEINGLIGAKLTRKSTFVKYLDSDNFIDIDPPENFDPDPNAYFPDDIFYFNQKTRESKSVIEFELKSILDLRQLKLPNRIVSANQCPFMYRGAGCLYEYNARRNTAQHGTTSESTLPLSAPSIANDKNEKVLDVLKNKTGYTSQTSIKDRGKWRKGITYSLGDQVYITKGTINYYFVCIVENTNNAPPNKTYWFSDVCAKDLKGCGLRWKNKGQGLLRFGGFPSVNTLS